MKKLGLLLAIIAGIGFANFAPEAKAADDYKLYYASIVFRQTQRLRSSDGREIYLYCNGRCELFDDGRLVVECTYKLSDGEIRLLDENGNTVYKGSYRLKSDRQNISNLTLAGTVYRSK